MWQHCESLIPPSKALGSGSVVLGQSHLHRTVPQVISDKSATHKSALTLLETTETMPSLLCKMAFPSSFSSVNFFQVSKVPPPSPPTVSQATWITML